MKTVAWSVCLPPFDEAFVDKQILTGMIEVWWVPISVLGVWCF